jgi:hypothetical protein
VSDQEQVRWQHRGGGWNIVAVNDEPKMGNFARLIHSVMVRDSNGPRPLTYRELTERAAAMGHALPSATIQRTLTSVPIQLTKRQVEIWRDTLGVPAERVAAAILADMGFAPYNPPQPTTEQMIRDDEQLSADDKDVMLTLLRFLLKRARSRTRIYTETSGSGTTLPQQVSGVGRDRVTYVHRATGGGDVEGGLDSDVEQGGEVRPEV